VGTDRAHHWDDVYGTKAADQVSWYQARPTTSLRLLTEAVPRPASVIDIGAGASTLADELLAAGITDVTVLDVSAAALDAVRRRLAGPGPGLSFVLADVARWRPSRTWDAWHDRAVFHFLTDPADRAAYAGAAAEAVAPGGIAVVAAFAPDGPDSCSGLPVVRWDAEGLAAELGPAFALEHAEREVHRTPWGSDQPFTWTVLRRR
jgi:trans-aconitate methyltransferase